MFRSPAPALAAAALALTFALAGCGGSSSGSSGGSESAAVLVTADCGKTTVVDRTSVDAPQNAMRALRRVGDVETDSNGAFVTAIEGHDQDTANKVAWLFYVDGKASQKGAAQTTLQPGQVEWWDLHDYRHECKAVPPEAQ